MFQLYAIRYTLYAVRSDVKYMILFNNQRAPSTQHPAPSIQHPAPNTQHPARNLKNKIKTPRRTSDSKFCNFTTTVYRLTTRYPFFISNIGLNHTITQPNHSVGVLCNFFFMGYNNYCISCRVYIIKQLHDFY